MPTITPSPIATPLINPPETDTRPFSLPTGLDRPTDPVVAPAAVPVFQTSPQAQVQLIAERLEALQASGVTLESDRRVNVFSPNATPFEARLTQTGAVNDRPGASTVSIAGQIADGVITRSEVIRRGPETEFQIRLDPPELGRVDIKVTTTPDGIKAEIRVANESVRAMVEGQLNELKQRLESAGMPAHNCQVSTSLGDEARRQQDEDLEELLNSMSGGPQRRKMPPVRNYAVPNAGSGLNITV